MSVFNMMFAGGGGGGFKTATPMETSSGSALTFHVDSEPQEYVVLMSTSYSISNGSTTRYLLVICDMENRKFASYVYPYQSSAARFYIISPLSSYISTSYSTGLFTVNSTSSSNKFHSSYTYILFYR